MNRLRVAFAPYWQSIQHALFPQLECVLGPLTEKQQQLVQTLEVIRIEQMVPPRFRVPGRPPKDRAAMARALVAKAVYDMPTTRVLLDRLVTDVALRRICGWERKSEVPSESVFSRAFAEFSDTQLPQRVHEALIGNTHRDRLVGHLSRDSTAIAAREKPAAKQKAPPPPKRKRGRPKKGEERPKVLKRLDRQSAMSLPEMLDDLPTDCDVGMKKDSKGYKSTWVGYKLHLDVADGQIPISCLLTSASLHDSQAAIPLATLSAERTTNLYDLMDAAYDAEPIRQHSRSLGHVPLIDTNPRRNKALAEELRTEARRLKNLGFQLAEQVTPRLSLEPSVSFNWLDLPQGRFSTELVTTRTTYSLSPLMFVSALLQYNSSNASLGANLRLRWEYQPGSELFVVYNEARDTLRPGRPELRDRALIIKINWLFRL